MNAAVQAPPWPALAVLLAIPFLYSATLWPMVVLWAHSQTFAHGFAIVPISAWLAWRRRADLAAIGRRPSAWGCLLLLALGAAWLLAALANVRVVAQYASVAMIPASVVATLGWATARALAFPLAYLLLAVPFGEVLVPPLIDFTARFTVAALQLTGVPVFRENNYFSIPSGNWSVIEACSGLRYLIASAALGTLYAYLSFRSLARRLLFIAVALLVPILANGLRAYLIVMIGHLSGMRLAVGIDHMVYGWVFFGLVCLLLFWAASFWPETAPPAPSLPPAPPVAPVLSARRAAGAAALALAALACWPLLATVLLAAPAPRPGQTALALALAPPPWQVVAGAPGDWRATHAGAPLSLLQNYRAGPASVALQLAWYANQEADAELLAVAAPADAAWRALAQQQRTLSVAGRALSVRQSVLQNGERHLLVWRWYRQGGRDTASPALVKLLLAKSKLLRAHGDGAEIIVSAPFDEQSAPAEAALRAFLAAMLPAIDRSLDHAARL